MKVPINTIGKKIHVLVNENTPCCDKKGRNVVSLKRLHFSLCYCVFFPTVMQILVGRLDSYLLTHTKKYMTPLHALNILKNMSKCVLMQDMLKSRCKFVTLLGKYTYAQQKQVGWEVIFSELGFAGSRARKPWRELEGSALDFFCCLF